MAIDIPSLNICRDPFARNREICGAFIKTPRCEFENGTVGVYQSAGARIAWGWHSPHPAKSILEFLLL
jgi:hypothetical protein